MAAALISFAAWGQATRKAQVSGVLMPAQGLLHLGSPQPARVAQVLVNEGDMVKEGQLLAVLQTGGASTKGDTVTLIAKSLAERRLGLESEKRVTTAQAQQRHNALADRLRSLQTDIGQAEGELEAAQRRAQLSSRSLARDQQLAEQGFVSQVQVQTRQEEGLDIQVRERNAQRNLEGLRREAQSVQADMRANELQAQAQHAQLDRALASLGQEDTENTARAEWTLRAPKAGQVGAVSTAVGQWLQAGQTVLSLIPQTAPTTADASLAASTRTNAPPAAHTLHAQLYAPSRTAGFIEPGQAVWLRLQAFPYQKFGMVRGDVTAVSRTPVNPGDLPAGMSQALLSAAGANEPLYRITVALPDTSIQAYGKAQTLRAGMTLDADVIQDRRAIWEWVLEPLFGITARVHAT